MKAMTEPSVDEETDFGVFLYAGRKERKADGETGLFSLT